MEAYADFADLNYDNLETIIERVNRIKGPIVKKVNDVIGYGLFADKDYEIGEKVTQYGGKKVSKKASGSYVVQVSSYAYDAEFEFNLKDKGRWINDSKDMNVTLKKEGLWFVTTKQVKKGEEFLWYYGKDYNRDWNYPKKTIDLLSELQTANKLIESIIVKTENVKKENSFLTEQNDKLLMKIQTNEEFYQREMFLSSLAQQDKKSINAVFKYTLF